MATIEERAKDFADRGLPNNIEGAIRYTYIYAANEQQKLDIEKACEWLHSTIGDGFVRYGNDRMVADNDQFEAMFRKAMEG